MKYSIRYYKGCNLNNADEVIIKLFTATSQLIDFVEKYKDKDIVLDISENTDVDLKKYISVLAAAASKNKNFKVMLSYKEQFNIIPDLYAENIKYFFSEGAFSWDTLRYFIDNQVSDIIIYGELGFDLKNVRDFCNKYNVQVRATPNLAQTTVSFPIELPKEDSFKTFFIRPEDVSTYARYIDILTFSAPLEKQDILIQIYKSGKWKANLNLLILDTSFNIDNRTIGPFFAEKRISCQKRCNQDKCFLCDSIYELGLTLEEQEYQFKEGEKYEYRVDETDMSNESIRSTFYDDSDAKTELSEDYLD